MGAKPCPGELKLVACLQGNQLADGANGDEGEAIAASGCRRAAGNVGATTLATNCEGEAKSDTRSLEISGLNNQWDLLSARGEQLPPRRGPRRPVPTLVDSPLQQALVCSTEHAPGVEDGSSVGVSVGGWTFGGPT